MNKLNEYQQILNDLKYRCDDTQINKLELVMGVLEKETPKKTFYANGVNCYNCNCSLQWEYPRCPFCGQVLDWEER